MNIFGEEDISFEKAISSKYKLIVLKMLTPSPHWTKRRGSLQHLRTFVEHLRADRLALPADPVLVLGRHAEVVGRPRPQVLHDERHRVTRRRHLAPLHLARVTVVWKQKQSSFCLKNSRNLGPTF